MNISLLKNNFNVETNREDLTCEKYVMR